MDGPYVIFEPWRDPRRISGGTEYASRLQTRLEWSIGNYSLLDGIVADALVCLSSHDQMSLPSIESSKPMVHRRYWRWPRRN